MLQEIVEGHAKSWKGAASIASSTSSINILSKVYNQEDTPQEAAVINQEIIFCILVHFSFRFCP